ncbi:hypothetical protein PR202_gb23171 [Eleusine coracana subsp. coracana]|uniref:Uncharacterized protein n=1 Tax=Eleusine coracana subsp. coracana TaxID=191504 RepID=A0AAV5FI38_ELECO|nr:hypothetical protein PR202_gb23171 [Eleusine coracana subsp. coracana]
MNQPEGNAEMLLHCATTPTSNLEDKAPVRRFGFVSLLRSHAAGDPRRLSEIHSQAVVSGLDRDRFVAAGLVARYAALGRAGLESARKMFDRVPHRDAILWNVML